MRNRRIVNVIIVGGSLRMKALKVVGSIVLALVVAGGIGYAAFAYGKSQSSTASTNNSNNDSSNNQGNKASNNVTPKIVTDPTCNADELSIVLGEGNGAAAGSRSLSLVFSNNGDRECTLSGYPGVSLVNANGNQIGSPADRAASTNVKTVMLKSTQSTSALVTYPVEANFDAGTCTDGATKLRVYPPNDVGYISVVSPITGWCPGFQVGPVVAE